MKQSPIAILKLDGGYLITCNGESKVRTDWDGAVAVMRDFIDNPPPEEDGALLANILRDKTIPNGEPKPPPPWIEDALNDFVEGGKDGV